MKILIAIIIGLLTCLFVLVVSPSPERKTESKILPAQLQLDAYKEAEKICGIGNVKESPFILPERKPTDKDSVVHTTEFLCDDLKVAAISKDEQEQLRKKYLDERINRYCSVYSYEKSTKFSEYMGWK
jgi:hypothetical protein